MTQHPRRKAKRTSESKLRGTVIYKLVALLIRVSESSRVVGPPTKPSTVNDNPAGLLSRVRLGRMWCSRNWDMLLVASLRRRCQPPRLFQERQPVCDGQQKIVDQAKALGNARDTGVVPGHLRMEQNSTRAEEVKARCGSEVTSERRVDDGATH